jgi:MFS family permease
MVFLLCRWLCGAPFLGALFGGIPTEKYGRKTVLLWVGILFAVSAFGSAFAGNAYVFSFFRFMGGVGIGVSSVVAPIYISEISTPATRGRLVALYQFNIVFGILIAFLSNYFLQGVGGADDWRWMLGVLAVPALLYTVLVFGISESPRWLITKRNDLVKAKQIMLQIGVVDVEAETASIIESNRHDTATGNTTGFSPANTKRSFTSHS